QRNSLVVENVSRLILDTQLLIHRISTLLQSTDATTLWLVGADVTIPGDIAEHVTVARLPQSADAKVDPHAVIALVREHVEGSILVEGGGQTVSDFLTAGALDRLFLTKAPVLIGDGVPGIRFEGSDQMSKALRYSFRRYIFDQDVCTEYMLSPAARKHSAQMPAQLRGVQEQDEVTPETQPSA